MTITADVPTPAAAAAPMRRRPDGRAGSPPRCSGCWPPPRVLYLWGLGSSGWANSYYAAAAQAGTQDLKAWLFGSLDPGNAITVDKPPAAMWVMALSGRLFGFSPFTMLLPQALMGVGAVALLYAAVRRCSGPAAGLIAGAVLALTPGGGVDVPVQQPRRIAGAACWSRPRTAWCAPPRRRARRWMALAGCALGFAFLTKMLQAFLVAPGLALAFLVAAPVGLWQRIRKLMVGAVAMIVSAGWYVALVSLWPASHGRTSPARRTTACCSWRWATTGLSASPAAATAGGGPGGDISGGPGSGPAVARAGPVGRGPSVLRWRSRHRPAVRDVDGHRGVVAAARRVDRAGRGTVAHPADCPHRRRPCEPAAVGRLAAGDRRGVQLHGRHRPPVLHGRARACDRRAGRYLGA